MQDLLARMIDVTAAIACGAPGPSAPPNGGAPRRWGRCAAGVTTPAIMAGRGLLYCGRMPGPARAISPEAPDLAAELPEASLEAAEVENGGSWSQVRLSDAALPGLAATGLRSREVALGAGRPGGARRLINLAFADVELDTCNLATVGARSGSMRRVTARGCRMTGLLWTERERDVVLRDCRIDLASFAATTIEQVVFDGLHPAPDRLPGLRAAHGELRRLRPDRGPTSPTRGSRIASCAGARSTGCAARRACAARRCRGRTSWLRRAPSPTRWACACSTWASRTRVPGALNSITEGRVGRRRCTGREPPRFSPETGANPEQLGRSPASAPAPALLPRSCRSGRRG